MRTMRIPIGGRKFVHYIMDKTGKVHECYHEWKYKRLKKDLVCTVICKKYGIKFIGEV